MTIAKRPGVPRYLRKTLVARQSVRRTTVRPAPVLIRTVAFIPAYLRKRLH